jgi:hypothetical protein
MHRKVFLELSLFFLLTVSAGSALSAPQQDFDTGVMLFNQGDYRQSLVFFERAEAGGLASPQLIYNLGSVTYKLAMFDRSRRYFEILIGNPGLGALAQYNIGLVEHKLGNSAAAIESFEASRDASDDERLRALAKKQIDSLQKSEPKAWFGYGLAGYGYDSNITAQPTSSASGESASYLETLGLIGWRLSGSDAEGIHSTASYYARDYSGGSDFDNDTLILDAELRGRVDRWTLAYGLQAASSTYGGEDYLSHAGAVFRARTRLESSAEIRLEILRETISNRRDEFFYLDGERTRLKAEYRSQFAAGKIRHEYKLESNDRANTDTTSQSPTRHEYSMQYMAGPWRKTRLGGVLEYRYSDYERVGPQDRLDRRWRVRLKGEYRLDSTWRIKGELLFTDNRSSESEFEYHKYQAGLSINAFF